MLGWQLILYLQSIKNVVSVENDSESYYVSYIFLRARMIYTCSASFVEDDRLLIELINMQQKRNKNRKFLVKSFFNFCCFQGGDFGGGILLPVYVIINMPICICD